MLRWHWRSVRALQRAPSFSKHFADLTMMWVLSTLSFDGGFHLTSICKELQHCRILHNAEEGRPRSSDGLLSSMENICFHKILVLNIVPTGRDRYIYFSPDCYSPCSKNIKGMPAPGCSTNIPLTRCQTLDEMVAWNLSAHVMGSFQPFIRSFIVLTLLPDQTDTSSSCKTVRTSSGI